MPASLLRNGQTILFVGDSITDCGRRAEAAPLGNGYVAMFREILTARRPDFELAVINKGISGNKVDDLRHRWHDDVMRETFDWLAVKIGINDIHRQLREPDAGWSVRKFREDYDAILDQTVKTKQTRLVLIDPFYLSTDRSGLGFRSLVLALLDDYIEVVTELAARYDAVHIRTQERFRKCLETHVPDEFCPEPVHPFRAGHLAIALELYSTLFGAL